MFPQFPYLPIFLWINYELKPKLYPFEKSLPNPFKYGQVDKTWIHFANTAYEFSCSLINIRRMIDFIYLSF